MRQPMPCLILLMSAFAVPVSAADQTVQRQEGRAYATADGRLLYRETHWLQGPTSAQSRLVLYRCSDGRPFARKWMTPQGNPQTPDFMLDDGRDGYQEGVRGTSGARQVSVRASAQAPTFSRAIAIPPGPWSMPASMPRCAVIGLRCRPARVWRSSSSCPVASAWYH